MTTIKRFVELLENYKASLLREIKETKDLNRLLIKGLKQPLTPEERRQIKRQLLDICLTIPALSVAFGTPGGSILIVLLYRMLPAWLIPSAFRQPVVEECQAEEMFCVVDEDDNVIGFASRQECHGNPLLIHRVSHVLVFTPGGELILQERALNKDIQPGKWDTSVGGHLRPDEDYQTAAHREMEEELGITGLQLEFLYKYKLRNNIESENVATYKCIFGGDIKFDPREITQVRAWNLDEIRNNLGSGVFTPNFEEELANYLYLTRS